MSESQNIEYKNSMTKEELLKHLQDIEWDNFEVKTAKTDISKDIWETLN
jgi:ATP-dependent DNA helicase RecG